MKKLLMCLVLVVSISGCASMQTRLDHLDMKNRQGKPMQVEEVAIGLLGATAGYAVAYHYGEWWGVLGWTAICMRW